MGAGHTGSLYVARQSFVHRLAPAHKIVAVIAFVFVVVGTPREQFWAFGLFATTLMCVAALAGLRPQVVLSRLTVEIPFIAFALFLPFLARGARIDLGPLSLSVEGLWAAWNILAKGTLGVLASVILTATTPIAGLIGGLQALRVPSLFVAIASFMVRYAEVIAGEMRRMKVARESRGHDPRWIWQIRAVAASAGTLFVRSFERGERVHLAMASRGYTGRMPSIRCESAPAWSLAAAAALPCVAVIIGATAWSVG